MSRFRHLLVLALVQLVLSLAALGAGASPSQAATTAPADGVLSDRLVNSADAPFPGLGAESVVVPTARAQADGGGARVPAPRRAFLRAPVLHSQLAGIAQQSLPDRTSRHRLTDGGIDASHLGTPPPRTSL